MKSALFLPAMLVLVCVAGAVSGAQRAQRRSRPPRPPDLKVLECAARRSAGQISIDGRVRNTGEKPVRGLVLLFDFFAPNRQPLTTQKASVDEELIEPGKEASFRVALNEPPRAVEVAIGGQDGDGRELRMANPGPFVID